MINNGIVGFLPFLGISSDETAFWSWENFQRIWSVFRFQFDGENPLSFTAFEFWVFFFAIIAVFAALNASWKWRVVFMGLTIGGIAFFFRNGDFLVIAGWLATLYLAISHHEQFLPINKAKRIGLGIGATAIAGGYFVFKTLTGPVYFNITPIDVWLGLFGLVFLLSLFKQKYFVRSIFLALISLFFYFKSSDKFVFLLIASLLINYFLGKAIYKTERPSGKKWIIALSAVVNLFILGYFKYTYFFTESWNSLMGTNFEPTNMFAEFANWLMGDTRFMTTILLPVGVSFFTFQSISYVVDIYRKEIEPVKNFFDYAFFVTFFPQLVAGPIVRARDFIPQIRQPYEVNKEDYSWAVIQIVKGLIKKVVLADFIAVHFIDKIADAPEAYPGFVSVLAMWGYSLQIYGDFSGYTDMAIGISRLMGFKLLENFNSPYKAISVADFWRRWHKSLGSWLRDYLYIPLGGNRSGGIGTYIAITVIFTFLLLITQWWELLFVYLGLTIIYLIGVLVIPNFKKYVHRDLNLLITMVIGGLWHGASENFVIWGAMNGVALVIYNYWKKISPYENATNYGVRFWRIFLTFNFITFTRIWFRLEDDGAPLTMLDQIWNHFGFNWDVFVTVLQTYQSVFWVMLAGFIVHWLPQRWKLAYEGIYTRLPIALQMVAVAGIIFLMYQAQLGESKAFVYFQF